MSAGTRGQKGAAITSADDGERLCVLGDNQRVLLTGEQTGGAFMMFEQRNHPGTGVPQHYHTREEETFHVVSGKVRFTLEEETLDAQPGFVVHIPKGVKHSFRVLEEAHCVVHCRPAGIEEMFRELNSLPAGPPDFAKVAEICGRYGVYFG